MKILPVVCDSPFIPDDCVEQRGEEEYVDPREWDSNDFRWLETQDFNKNSIRPVELHFCWAWCFTKTVNHHDYISLPVMNTSGKLIFLNYFFLISYAKELAKLKKLQKI